MSSFSIFLFTSFPIIFSVLTLESTTPTFLCCCWWWWWYYRWCCCWCCRWCCGCQPKTAIPIFFIFYSPMMMMILTRSWVESKSKSKFSIAIHYYKSIIISNPFSFSLSLLLLLIITTTTIYSYLSRSWIRIVKIACIVLVRVIEFLFTNVTGQKMFDFFLCGWHLCRSLFAYLFYHKIKKTRLQHLRWHQRRRHKLFVIYCSSSDIVVLTNIKTKNEEQNTMYLLLPQLSISTTTTTWWQVKIGRIRG